MTAVTNEDEIYLELVASSPPADSSHDDVIKLVTCSTCTERYVNPKLLLCFHSCCARCVQIYKKRNQDNIICSLCRMIQPFPKGGLAAVSPNFTIEAILLAMKEPPPTKDTCEACEEKRNPEFLCATCNVQMCDSCRVAHGNLKITKDHEIIPAMSIKLSPLEIIGNKSQRQCKKHYSAIKYRCNTCGVFVCHEEYSLEHKDHRLGSLEEIRNGQKISMTELEIKAEHLIQFSRSVKSSVKSYEIKVLSLLRTLELAVDRTISEAVEKLQEEASILITRIEIKKEQEAQRRADMLPKALQVKRSATIVRNIMQKATSMTSDLDALTLYACCEQILDEALTDKQGITYRNELFFRPSEFLLHIRASEECGAICEMGNYPDFLIEIQTKALDSIPNVSGIARSRYGDIALTSFWDDKFVLISPEGTKIRDMSEQVMRPWDVAFTSDNAIVISQGGLGIGHGQLNVFTPAGSFVRSIAERSSSLAGIAVDRAGRLLACDDREACVKIFSPDGTLVDQIKNQDGEFQFRGPLYVTANINDDIVVCDDHRSVKIFSSAGRAKGMYKVSDEHHLQGVCTDSHGQILVVDSAKKGIHVLKASGALRRFISLPNVGEMQSICAQSPTSVLIAGKSPKVLIVKLFQEQNLAQTLT